MKIVINGDFGGFSISRAAAEFMAARGNGLAKQELDEAPELGTFYGYINIYINIDRDDPDLIAAVEGLREKANGSFASLKIVEIPEDVEWEIDDYDGLETIHEKHRSWS